MMLKLEEVSEEHESSYLAMKEDWTSSQFQKFVKECAKQRMDWRPKAGKVSVTHYVLRNLTGAIVACAWLRFPLDSVGEKDGGNLQVEVPLAFRGQGNGSYALSLLLFEAVRAGLARALCTCNAEDQAARRVIEKNRGQLLDIVRSPSREQDIARYWISFR